MKTTVKGLVLKEVKLREADKILTLFTPGQGIISASARGAMRPNNKFFSASGLYCYSEWTLHEGKAMYSVVEASPLEVFFGLRQSIEGIALAAYMAEIVQILSPTGYEADALLRLTLNSLYLLSENKRSVALVKAVFELRAMSVSGFMPEPDNCEDCDLTPEAGAYFSVAEGSVLCERCAINRNLTPNLNGGALAALRHIVASDEGQVFGFALSDEGVQLLGRVTESFMLYHMDWPPKSLAFLKTVL